jgi:hypothetical protein
MGTSLKHLHTSALIKLSRASGLYPECMTLRGIELLGDSAIDGGGFGDIWKGLLRGQEIAVKVLRIFRQSDKVQLLKVSLCTRDHDQLPSSWDIPGVYIRGCDLAPTEPSKCSSILRRISLGK